jgi:hypothetical protein
MDNNRDLGSGGLAGSVVRPETAQALLNPTAMCGFVKACLEDPFCYEALEPSVFDEALEFYGGYCAK